MIAFINGMFCQSLQCELFTKAREREPYIPQKKSWGVATLALLEMSHVLGKQSVMETKVDLLIMEELRLYCSLKFTDRSHFWSSQEAES